jgi:hypothetical protein
MIEGHTDDNVWYLLAHISGASLAVFHDSFSGATRRRRILVADAPPRSIDPLITSQRFLPSEPGRTAKEDALPSMLPQ